MRKRLILPLAVAVITALAACSSPKEWHKAQGSVWHTLYSITYLADRDLSDTIIAAMRSVELSLSPFDSTSVISRINRGESCLTDPQVRTIFACSQQVNRLSDGLFDPTVAPLINYWGYGFADESHDSIPALLERVGIAECRINSDGTIHKKHPLTEFNFSAITKGYGCDAVGEALRRNGCTDYLVEIGGELALSGLSPRGDNWTVMIDAPVDDNRSVRHDSLTTLSLTNCGIATSGNYRNYRITAQGKTSHTIDPRNGLPVTLEHTADTTILSATVVAPNCMLADALATASMLLPPSRSRTMAARAGASRLILCVATPTDSLLVIDRSGLSPTLP